MRLILIGKPPGELSPFEFSYANGYLSQVRHGDWSDTLTVEAESLDERLANLKSKDTKSGVKHTGKVAGRLLKDDTFQYSYSAAEPGKVKLTNKLRQSASYDYSAKTGVFKLEEFSGKKYEIYYFMRYDVAYLGKVRKIVDGRGRDVVNYRYDKLSGNVVRVRDMAGNDTEFSYDADGNLQLISRRAAEQEKPEPVTSFAYDKAGNPVASSRLDANGKAVVTT